MSLPPVTFDGQYFVAGGRRFLPVGAHWIPAQSALQWPTRWDEAEIEADFAKMHELGFNVVRLDLFWAWFEPRPGHYNPQAFRQLDFLLDLAHKYHLYLHPALFIGNEVGEAYWDVPWRNGRHPHADPTMLRLQTDHAAELARRYRHEAAILAWDLTDEPPFWIVADTTDDDMALNWTRLIASALRRYAPRHPICVGTDVQDLTHGPFRPDIIADEVDFFTVHPYPIYLPHLFPDPLLSERATYCAAFQTTLSAGAGKSAMVHELGASAAQYAPQRIAQYDRTALYSALAAGANGFILWCYTDAAPRTYHRLPYLRAPHETQFGLTTWDRRDRPAGAALREFSRLMTRLDLTDLVPAKPKAALIVPHEWAKPRGDFSRCGLEGPSIIPYISTQEMARETDAANAWLIGSLLSAFILARRVGLNVAMPREYTAWHTYPLLLLPSPLTGTEINLVHLHTTFWERARQYVVNGGTLYASLCADAAIPDMASLFGARLVDHVPVEAVTLILTAPFGDLPAGTTFHFQANPTDPRQWPVILDIQGGRVIAEDQDGRPALVTHSLGNGRTLLSAYPLEHYMAVTPLAFERNEEVHRLYRALRLWADVHPPFTSNHPAVEVGALLGAGRAYAILTNHSAEPHTITVTSHHPITSAALITADETRPLSLHADGWAVTVPPYNGAIVEATFAARGREEPC